MDPIFTYTNFVLQWELVVKSVINTGSPLNDPSVLHELYVEKRLSQRQMAGLFASSKTSVQRALIRFNIDTNRPGNRLRPNPVNIPYGKKIVHEELVDHTKEQRVISLISALKKSGVSNRGIALHLNERMIPTKKKSTKGWHHEMIRQILLRAENISQET